MRILITGGAGFIGSNVARKALEAGHEVSILDDLSTGTTANIDLSRIRFIEGSILNEDHLAKACAGASAILHLAALGSVPRSIADPLKSHEVNSTGTLRVLEAARENDIQHVVYSSSSSVYGMNPALPKSEREWVRAMSPYAASKLAAEQYTLAYQQSYGLDTLAFRFFNVYGPHQRAGHVYAAVIPTFIQEIKDKRPIKINGDGETSRDFTYVGTVTDAVIYALEHRITHPEPVNLAFGTNTTLNNLVQEIESISGWKSRITHGPERPGDVRHSQADARSLKELMPKLRAVELKTGLRETIEWFKKDEK